jgi:hypothetical protein
MVICVLSSDLQYDVRKNVEIVRFLLWSKQAGILLLDRSAENWNARLLKHM